ncbi:hypothetical protein J32TS2_28510 [Shouchella clausii]|uniref:hypothetical protein n=1 Tax=Shouchella clausii TaxID=79880 RepID=UPI001B1776CC|nr:hypothetical protein [Shouchella clausii]GIN17495.1 hypothetical protein J32TS2_28510 [Shouchella clausii]
MEKLKPCPFCGGEVQLGINDAEGNHRNEDYERDPWSGICYTLQHFYENNKGCPIATFNKHESDGILGTRLYDDREEAIQAWNKRI